MVRASWCRAGELGVAAADALGGEARAPLGVTGEQQAEPWWGR